MPKDKSWYARWHRHPNHQLLQWLLLIIVVAGFTWLLYSRINQENPVSYGRDSKAWVQLPTVRAIYLIPSDKTYNPAYEASIANAVIDLNTWYQGQLGSSFQRSNPIVQHYTLSQNSAYFQGSGASGDFWERAVGAGFSVTGGKFDDPNNVWLYYIDADPLPKQLTGGTHGVALLPRGDLLGLTGSSRDNTPVTRWVGGLGHELGHAFGLPHPPGCDQDQSQYICQTSLMYFGFSRYPNTYLTDSDKQLLLSSTYFTGSGTKLAPGTVQAAGGGFYFPSADTHESQEETSAPPPGDSNCAFKSRNCDSDYFQY